ncbi:hypothetical protein BMR1_03g03791 [Babesia microti strain RI]|uniref:Uncharacterized protein n=1 Tax=Babesia microti (strain RI) TaxID=1133968 RepID=A0A1R4ACC3_BABMR|nr:hypothetical protein BMR1_03g03791 [Babesia microti strain RI]SJK86605.1 hypothetical protein BMR1_03g03791 [Babesia microti strain RI]|eukprot:XP_021338744.1 hypothetical protein BMR1_03g03791 [Babesia microti strain RI]
MDSVKLRKLCFMTLFGGYVLMIVKHMKQEYVIYRQRCEQLKFDRDKRANNLIYKARNI